VRFVGVYDLRPPEATLLQAIPMDRCLRWQSSARSARAQKFATKQLVDDHGRDRSLCAVLRRGYDGGGALMQNPR